MSGITHGYTDANIAIFGLSAKIKANFGGSGVILHERRRFYWLLCLIFSIFAKQTNLKTYNYREKAIVLRSRSAGVCARHRARIRRLGRLRTTRIRR